MPDKKPEWAEEIPDRGAFRNVTIHSEGPTRGRTDERFTGLGVTRRPKASPLPSEDADQVEAAEAELLAETDRALAAAARHGDRIDELLEQIRAVRADTLAA